MFLILPLLKIMNFYSCRLLWGAWYNVSQNCWCRSSLLNLLMLCMCEGRVSSQHCFMLQNRKSFWAESKKYLSTCLKKVLLGATWTKLGKVTKLLGLVTAAAVIGRGGWGDLKECINAPWDRQLTICLVL